VDGQLIGGGGRGGATRDYVCTYLFDADGDLVEHRIDGLGPRDNGTAKRGKQKQAEHLVALGKFQKTDIWIKPFTVQHDGAEFGLVVREITAGEWVVDAVPGWTIMFTAPWALGEYDT